MHVCTAPSLSHPSSCFPTIAMEAEFRTPETEHSCRPLKWVCSPSVICHFKDPYRQLAPPLSSSVFFAVKHTPFSSSPYSSDVSSCQQHVRFTSSPALLLQCSWGLYSFYFSQFTKISFSSSPSGYYLPLPSRWYALSTSP